MEHFRMNTQFKVDAYVNSALVRMCRERRAFYTVGDEAAAFPDDEPYLLSGSCLRPIWERPRITVMCARRYLDQILRDDIGEYLAENPEGCRWRPSDCLTTRCRA